MSQPLEDSDLQQFIEGLGPEQSSDVRRATSSRYPEPAGFWIRVGATLIDELIFLPLIAIAVVALSARSGYLLLLVSLPGFLYKPFMESCYGATLGKMICQLKVIDRQGENLRLWRAYVRFLPFLASQAASVLTAVWLVLTPQFWLGSGSVQLASLIDSSPARGLDTVMGFVVLIDCVVVAFSHRKRAVHDMIAGSFCIRGRRIATRPKPSQAETRGFLRTLESEE